MAEQFITRQIRSGEQLSCSSGKSHKLIIQAPRLLLLIDGHSHIQSGACCPLPLVWAQPPLDNKHKWSRNFITFIASAVKGDVWKLQKKSTEEIAAKLVEEILRTCGPASPLRTSKNDELFAISITMPMDMDFAHIAGYDGSMVYHETDKKVIYYERSNAYGLEKTGKVVDLTSERPNRVWVYQHYIKQYRAIRNAVLKYPWILIPMFHYDPRRWLNPSGGEMDYENWLCGPWDYPFELIATLKRAGLFIGFKMYPPLGYQPLDPRLPHLKSFYQRCIAEGIPILVHCSPGGMVTHEVEFYHQIDKVDLATRNVGNDPVLGYNPCTPKGYFYHEYVHPKNWRTVLENGNKDLKLCLAHCGGDEWIDVGIESDWIQEVVNLTREFDNVYTDVACYNLENDAMRHNIGCFSRRFANRRSTGT